MPSHDKTAEEPKKGRIIKSAFDSESFEADGTIHVDGLVGSATISPSGRDIALASPDGLAIIDLDSPYNPPRRLRSPGMPWLVVDVQWSPFAARDYWVVSTANHRALVWNLNMREDSSSGPIEHSLQGHSRAITDVNFSAHHPDLLATCSVDGSVHTWDLRRPRQPVLTFYDWFAGATQVKYNRQDSHIVASAHDRWLHIWDERKASKPIRSITAHTSKIYGIDWNRTRSTGIVTCSLDKSIKFWDYETGGDEPEHIIRTDYPVWRARHTPFGWGLLAMPQNEPGDLFLYDRLWSDDSPVEASPPPAAIFPGHGEHKAKEFLWRSRGGVSEAGMDERHARGGPARKGLKITRKGASYRTFRAVDDSSSKDRKTGTMSDQRISGHPQQRASANAGARASLPYNRYSQPVWRGPSMKAKALSSRKTTDSQSAIGWMKGITMNKRKTSTDTFRRLPSKVGLMSHSFPEDQWGEPDTIQEELLRVSTQIPKVKWDNIDMDSLTFNASLTGPWGVDADSIFIKVKIDVPTGYPKRKAPKFTIEKSSFMPEGTHKRLHREIHKLASQFLLRKQNCLEVAFTYLLGEVDLESSTTFFKNVRDLDDDLDGLADDSSSEDEDPAATGSASMSQELPSTGEVDTTIAPHGRAIMPPPPRTCGARFSNDGKLVCFFPTKEEKFRALFSSTGDVARDRPKNEPFFAGFGRLSYDQSPRQRENTEEASATDDQSGDSDSDRSSSDSSSSDSESTSIHNMNMWYRPSRQPKKAWSEDRSVRSSGAGTGTGTGTGIGTATGTGMSRRRIVKARNVISIHDLRADLPSKREFAEEYAIFGDGADVCNHNARVAEKHGFADLSNIWLYLALLLRQGIPLEVLGGNTPRGDSILVIARDVVSRVGHIDKNAPPDPWARDNALFGRVRWGQHPLAKDLIADLFDHFESTADIQMLAMLACIFSEASAEHSVAYAKSNLPKQETPLPLKAPSYSLDYFPADATSWNIYSRSFTNSAITTPGTLHTPVNYARSQTSDDGVWNAETGPNSFSCGETPPSKGKSLLNDQESTVVLSKSPSSRPIQQKGSTGFASTLAANLPRSFTGTATSTSPPLQGKKKPSPAEMILNSIAPRTVSSSGGGTAGVVGSGGGRTSMSDDDALKEDLTTLVPTNIAVILEDQSIFDEDGWMSYPLLDPRLSDLYTNYRYAYAELLQMWEQPLARLEVMKFNILKEDASPNGLGDSPFSASGSGILPSKSSPLVIGKQDNLQALLASGRGLDIIGLCRVHETQLEPLQYTSSDPRVGGAVGTCDRCQQRQNKLLCVYCTEPVDALFPTCLACGCASHEDCLGEWHAAGETQCPAGDECNCVEEAANGQVESWAALQAAMLKGRSTMSLLPDPAIGSGGEEQEEVAVPDKQPRGWARLGFDTAAGSGSGKSRLPVTPPVSLGFGPFKRTAGSWSRGTGQKRGGRRGG
ncbi:WD repeat protein [Cordyceps fumosorosea ARSEF 2679]|uniref:WD repeat protein n=1 Tax=Cordyceps fumosorosea (strain ARSEF 2679) TaxID=1081104 RepID=A0A168D2V9_CORFA|nr:WD repeat protein [Cordyceps fumosorosea ARSEF 2679]OAA72103.1 WD repeat protein [Cordyceps fumosorosea ARSEF 2679]